MASLNKVMLIGNLGRDPETRQLPSGVSVTTIAIATSESYTDKNGERKETTEWHNIELWDNLSKIASQYLRKGSPVYIEGKIKTDSWEDNGVKKYATKIRATGIQLLGSKGENSSSSYETSAAPAVSTSKVQEPNLAATESDDLPF
ncbi:MAG: single-stranded DNA-binding protein [Cytophagales bacterium]